MMPQVSYSSKYEQPTNVLACISSLSGSFAGGPPLPLARELPPGFLAP